MATTAYFSGVESNQHFDHCVRAGVGHVLMSFWQFHDKNLGIVAQRKKAHPHIKFMVDSGAHTFLTDADGFASRGWKERDFENYVRSYVDWLRRNRKYVDVGVELDIDFTLNRVLAGDDNAALGGNIVANWQQKYFKPLQAIGIPIIYVWHENRKMEGWKEMCSQFDYVGLPGEMSKNPDFNKFISVARRYCTRIHGFAATKLIDFRDIPWYSVDSITWKTGEMYGLMIVWDARTQTLTLEDDKTKRHTYRGHIEAAGFDADKIIADSDYKEVTRFSLWSMRQMELFYQDKYSKRRFYYDVRLPHPEVVSQWDAKTSAEWWKRFDPKERFAKHAHVGATGQQIALCAIAAIQGQHYSFLNGPKGDYKDFLKTYFPKLADPLVSDPSIFQQEMASYVSPRNDPAQRRSDPSHVTPVLNVRQRPSNTFKEEEAHTFEGHPFLV